MVRKDHDVLDRTGELNRPYADGGSGDAGLAAFDAQRLKHAYREAASEGRGKLAIRGALTPYLDFLNLFLFPLRFTAQRRE